MPLYAGYPCNEPIMSRDDERSLYTRLMAIGIFTHDEAVEAEHQVYHWLMSYATSGMCDVVELLAELEDK